MGRRESFFTEKASWLKLVRSIPPPKYEELCEITKSLEFFTFCCQYSLYDLYCCEYIESLAHYLKDNWKDKRIIEVAAGDGRFTSYLEWAGVPMLLATDSKDGASCDFDERFYGDNVTKMDALGAVAHFKADLVIGAWFPYGSDLPEKILETGTPLIFIGETAGGCCGRDELWEWPYNDLDCSEYSICRTDYTFGFGPFSKSQAHSCAVIFWPKKKGG